MQPRALQTGICALRFSLMLLLFLFTFVSIALYFGYYLHYFELNMNVICLYGENMGLSILQSNVLIPSDTSYLIALLLYYSIFVFP